MNNETSTRGLEMTFKQFDYTSRSHALIHGAANLARPDSTPNNMILAQTTESIVRMKESITSTSPNKFGLCTLIVCSFVLLQVQDVNAFPTHRRMAGASYGVKVACSMCHEYGGANKLNKYGKQWSEKGETMSAFKSLNATDSDEDGIDNLAEILAGSNPGEPRSTPKKPGRYARQIKKTEVPTSQLKLVFAGLRRVDVVEHKLSAEKISKIEAEISQTLEERDHFPTVYLGLNRKGSVIGSAVFQHFKLKSEKYSFLISMGRDSKVLGTALFRSGDEMGSIYHGYLKCMSGHGINNLPKAGTCPKPGKKTVENGLRLGTLRALATMKAVFAKKQK